MTRAHVISTVEAKLASLSDERVALLAEVVQSWSSPTVWSTLLAAERAKVDQALDSLDRGEGIPLASVEADIEALLAKSGQ